MERRKKNPSVCFQVFPPSPCFRNSKVKPSSDNEKLADNVLVPSETKNTCWCPSMEGNFYFAEFFFFFFVIVAWVRPFIEIQVQGSVWANKRIRHLISLENLD